MYYRYLSDSGEGFYYGAGSSYYEYVVDHKMVDQTVATNAYKPGVYIGYDILPIKGYGFFLDAWIGARFHPSGEERLEFSQTEDQYFIVPAIDGPLGMIKLGWRFDL